MRRLAARSRGDGIHRSRQHIKIQPPRAHGGASRGPRSRPHERDALRRRRPCCSSRRPASARPPRWPRRSTALPAGTALAWVSPDEGRRRVRAFATLGAALEPFDLPWRGAAFPALRRADRRGRRLARCADRGRVAAALAGSGASRRDRVREMTRTASPHLRRARAARRADRSACRRTGQVVIASRRHAAARAGALARAADSWPMFTQEALRFSLDACARSPWRGSAAGPEEQSPPS